jgi:hypothetical protein
MRLQQEEHVGLIGKGEKSWNRKGRNRKGRNLSLEKLGGRHSISKMAKALATIGLIT